MGTVCTVPATFVHSVDTMPIVCYQFPASPPCRAVAMTAKHLGVDLSMKEINLLEKEQLKPEFIKINPQHSVPTIDDGGFILWESRPIMTYLVNKYAPGNSLYPVDPQKRAEIDRMLYFDAGNYYKKQAEFFFPQLFMGAAPDEDKKNTFKESLVVLNEFLSKTPYAAGETLSLADLSIFAGVTFAEALDFDFSEYTHLTAWIEKLKEELPYHKEINEQPLEGFKKWLKEKKENK